MSSWLKTFGYSLIEIVSYLKFQSVKLYLRYELYLAQKKLQKIGDNESQNACETSRTKLNLHLEKKPKTENLKQLWPESKLLMAKIFSATKVLLVKMKTKYQEWKANREVKKNDALVEVSNSLKGVSNSEHKVKERVEIKDNWFLICLKDMEEKGPFTINQIAEKVNSGEILPVDRLRYAGDGTLVQFKDLDDLNTFVGKKIDSLNQISQINNTVDLKNNKSWFSKKRIFVITGACVLLSCLGYMGITVEKRRVKADSLWDSGAKDEAVAIYRDNRDLFSKDHRGYVYGRIIDFDYEKGNRFSADKIMAEARKEGIRPYLNNSDALAKLSALEASDALVAAKKREEEALASAEKKERERNSKMSPEQKLKNAPDRDLIHASNIYNEFAMNEVAAANQYEGKNVMLLGAVRKIEKGGIFKANRIILGSELNELVICDLSGGDEKILASLRTGDLIRVQGKCDGKGLFGTVMMSRCIFVKYYD